MRYYETPDLDREREQYPSDCAFTKTFTSETEADSYIAGYMREYHPDGYGTTARKSCDGSAWTVRFSRWSSCD